MDFKKFQKISISFLTIAIFVFLFSISVVSAYFEPTEPTSVDVSCSQYKYPWCQTGAQDPAGLVSTFYKIALGLAAAAAMGVLIYGAILWTVSGAISSKQDAMQYIWGAIWGLVLLLAAYVILYTINPNLVNLTNPNESFQSINSGSTNQVAPATNKAAINLLPLPLTSSEIQRNCPTCVKLSTFGDQVNCKSDNSCYVVRPLAEELITLKRNFSPYGIIWQVTEGYPPTPGVTHEDPCHNNGTCVDANFTADQIKNDPVKNVAIIKSFIQVADNAKLNAVYEVTNQDTMNQLVQAGIPTSNVRVISYATGSHFHVTMK